MTTKNLYECVGNYNAQNSITKDRKKGELDDLVDTHVYINRVEEFTDKTTGKKYIAFTTESEPDKFYFGGVSITSIVNRWKECLNLTIKEINSILANDPASFVIRKEKSKKNGRFCYNFVMNED